MLNFGISADEACINNEGAEDDLKLSTVQKREEVATDSND